MIGAEDSHTNISNITSTPDKKASGTKRGIIIDEVTGKSKRERKDDSGKKKLTLIQRSQLLEDFRNGNVKKTDLALTYGISKPRVTQIISEASKIDIAMKHIEPGSNVRRVVNGKFKAVDNGLLDWLRERKAVPVDMDAIKQKSVQIAEELGVQGFTPNFVWFSRFQKKHGLVKRPNEELYILEDVPFTSTGAAVHSVSGRSNLRINSFSNVNDLVSTLSELQKIVRVGFGLDEAAVMSVNESLNQAINTCSVARSVAVPIAAPVVAASSSSSAPVAEAAAAAAAPMGGSAMASVPTSLEEEEEGSSSDSDSEGKKSNKAGKKIKTARR